MAMVIGNRHRRFYSNLATPAANAQAIPTELGTLNFTACHKFDHYLLSTPTRHLLNFYVPKIACSLHP